MRNRNILLSVLAVITVTVFLVTLPQNLVVRTAEVYSFYFNDSSAVSKLYVDFTNNEFADEIVRFMNSWKPDEFQIYEDTGYDMQRIFDKDESYNMMCVKKWVDISLILCIVSFILTAAIYWYMIVKENEKKLLRRGFRIAAAIGTGISATEVFLFLSNWGRHFLADSMNMITLPEDAKLLTVLGPEFMSTAVIFLIIVSAAVFGVAIYVNYRLTRPPRIFY